MAGHEAVVSAEEAAQAHGPTKAEAHRGKEGTRERVLLCLAPVVVVPTPRSCAGPLQTVTLTKETRQDGGGSRTAKEGIVGEEVVKEISHGISLEEVPEHLLGIPENETKVAEGAPKAERVEGAKVRPTIRTGSVVVVAGGRPAIVDEALLPVLVVDLPLLLVREDLIGFAQLPESDRRLLLVVRILVRMPAQGQLPIP